MVLIYKGGDGISEIVCMLETSEGTGQPVERNYMNDN